MTALDKTNYFLTLPAPWVIAEIGINHNGDVKLAKTLIDSAKAAGADMVKFQSFSAESVACKETLSLPHVDASLGVEGTIYTLLEKLALPHSAQKELCAYAQSMGIPWTSTPFSLADIAFLADLDVPFIKIGSTDVTTPQILEAAAKTGKPILLSTGMATLAEVEAAVNIIQKAGNPHLALMHCVSLYPPQPEELNLKAIQTLVEHFPDLVIGYSDHSMGTWAAPAAVALGARIIEKHFTLDPGMAGPDQAVSASPQQMEQIITACKSVYAAMGTGEKAPPEREAANIGGFRRSVVSTRALEKGTILRPEHLALKRPGTGIPPAMLDRLIGLKLPEAMAADTPLSKSLLTLPVS